MNSEKLVQHISFHQIFTTKREQTSGISASGAWVIDLGAKSRFSEFSYRHIVIGIPAFHVDITFQGCHITSFFSLEEADGYFGETNLV